MYSNRKIPEPFCRVPSNAPAAEQRADPLPPPEKGSGTQDSLPLLALLLMEFLK